MQLFDTIAPHAARWADAVIAATEAEADYFRAIGASRVELIPPGVDAGLVEQGECDLEPFRARFKLSGCPVILTVARENSRKALPFGIETFQALRQQRPDVELLLVGAEGDRWQSIEGVHSTGWLERGDVALAYQTADVLFVPSLYEGLPRAVIEAWSFGLPVIATDRVALAPTIDRVGGRVVPYGEVDQAAEALASMLADADRARGYGEAGRRLVMDRFRLERSIGSTERLYQDLMEQRCASGRR
jgi:glycosyltransferase involved in cell wall biosynthesis